MYIAQSVRPLACQQSSYQQQPARTWDLGAAAGTFFCSPCLTTSRDNSSRHRSSVKLLKLWKLSLSTLHLAEGGTVSFKSGIILSFGRVSQRGADGLCVFTASITTLHRVHCGRPCSTLLCVTGWELRPPHVASRVPLQADRSRGSVLLFPEYARQKGFIKGIRGIICRR